MLLKTAYKGDFYDNVYALHLVGKQGIILCIELLNLNGGVLKPNLINLHSYTIVKINIEYLNVLIVII